MQFHWSLWLIATALFLIAVAFSVFHINQFF